MTGRSVAPILSTEPQPTQEHLASMNTTNGTEVETLKARILELEAMLRRAQVPVIQAGYSSMGFEIGRLLPSPQAVPR
jgi:hypothetical protein